MVSAFKDHIEKSSQRKGNLTSSKKGRISKGRDRKGIPGRGNSVSISLEARIKASHPCLELEGSDRSAMRDDTTGGLELDCVVAWFLA